MLWGGSKYSGCWVEVYDRVTGTRARARSWRGWEDARRRALDQLWIEFMRDVAG